MFLTYNSSGSRFFESALASAFFNSLRINLTDFSGQRPKNAECAHENQCSDHCPCGRLTLGSTKLFGLRSTAYTAIESSERNDLLVLFDVREVMIGLGQFQAYTSRSGQSFAIIHHTNIWLASESSSNFPHVLEVGAEVFTPRA